VAAALGLAAARSGKRTIVCEVARQERVSRAFHREGVGPKETELADGLYAISVDPQRAMKEYLEDQIGSRRLAGLLFGNQIFDYFAAATPGMRELTTIGKVWELAQLERRKRSDRRYDLVIVDAPASGHGLGMLGTPRTFREAVRVGPIHRQAGRIHSFITDPKTTGVVAVALPEEMPVNETVEFERALRRELDMSVDAIVVNAVHPARFRSVDVQRLRDVGGGSRVTEAAISAALSEHTRARAEHSQVRRLRRAATAPVTTLPRIFTPELSREDVERLSHELERKL
jgi:anion-transporting  ArsA/GET3 family ATPase